MDSVKYLTLQLKDDLREEILYENHSFPFSVCIDSFDMYLGREWSSHWHDEYEYGLVLDGEVEFTVYTGGQKSHTVKLSAGDGIFVGSGFLHSVKATVPKTVMAGFVFSNAFFNIKPFELVLSELIKPLVKPRVCKICFRKNDIKATEILSTLDVLGHLSKSEPWYELHCMELVFKLWRSTLKYVAESMQPVSSDMTAGVREQRLKQMISFIHSNYNENITVDDIAKHAFTSRTECFRCFKDILQKTPSDYLTEYRLSMAGAFLATTEHSLTDIAFSCGFRSISYFGKCFKIRYGISPKEYRKNANHSKK